VLQWRWRLLPVEHPDFKRDLSWAERNQNCEQQKPQSREQAAKVETRGGERLSAHPFNRPYAVGPLLKALQIRKLSFIITLHKHNLI
jgi:hypothetical protein